MLGIKLIEKISHAWNISYGKIYLILDKNLTEKKILMLGTTLHAWNKHFRNNFSCLKLTLQRNVRNSHAGDKPYRKDFSSLVYHMLGKNLTENTSNAGCKPHVKDFLCWGKPCRKCFMCWKQCSYIFHLGQFGHKYLGHRNCQGWTFWPR